MRDLSVVLGYVSLAIKPPDTSVDINHETQPSTIRDEKGGSGTIRSVMEEFLFTSLYLRDPGIHLMALTVM